MANPLLYEAENEAWENVKLSSLNDKTEDQSSSTHKVGLIPPRTLAVEILDTVKEAFFVDDPMRNYRDQPASKKLLLGIQAVFPIFVWGKDYTLNKFKGDLIAGLTIASLCIPQDIGYAKLANLDPQYGLYSSLVPPIIYAFMGSSRDIAIGPVAVICLLLGSLLSHEVDPSNKLDYLRLALSATFYAGVTQAALGLLRLGFLVEFLSHASIVGFMSGAAITIALQQLKGFLGIEKFTKESDIISVMKSVFDAAVKGWNWQTIVIGSVFLVFLITCKQIGKRKKSLFWVPAMAPLVSIILSTLSVYLTRADLQGVQIVKDIKKGLNPISFDQIYFSGEMGLKAMKIGAFSGLIALVEAAAIGRTFAAMKEYQLDGNKEMVAIGLMNMVGSMCSCFLATGSFSRSAVNYMAGCQTPVSNLVMSSVVFLTLLVITPLFKYTPNAILASIIINAVLGLIDVEATYHIWKVDKFDFVACTGAFFGVVFKNVEWGLGIAVGLSFAKILFQTTRPKTVLLGNIPGTTIYRNIQQYPEASRVAGVLIVRVDSAIYFSNSNYIRERILRWLTDEEDLVKANDLPKIEFIIVDMSSVADIDTGGIHSLEELYKGLTKRDLKLALANPGSMVMDKLQSSTLTETIGDDKIFLTVGEAVMNCSPRVKEEKA